MNTMLATILACAVVGPSAVMSHPGANPEAVAEVREGKRQTAYVSWWGFDPNDATAALQAAIDSGAKKVIVEDMNTPWVVRPIRLASDQELVLEKGVVLLAKRNEFKGGGDCLLSASGEKNVTITGPGATLRMWRDDYAHPPYQKAEWRHALNIRSCTHVRITGLTILESGGDGIYLGVSQKNVTNTDVVIRDVVCDRNYRQGISVISARDLRIENTVLRATAGTAPMAGIDFEPNHSSELLVNCVMRDCLLEANAGDGLLFALHNLTRDSTPISIRIENCRVVGNRNGFRLNTGNGEPRTCVPGSIEAVGCRFAGCEQAGIAVSNKPAAGCRVRFERCSIVDAAGKQPKLAPIQLSAGSGSTLDIGGIEFADVTVTDAQDRRPLGYSDRAGGLKLVRLSGTLAVEHQGQRTTYPLDQKTLDAWFPFQAFKRFPPFPMADLHWEATAPSQPPQGWNCAVRQRSHAEFMFRAEAGQEIVFTLRLQRVGKTGTPETSVAVVAPTGERSSLPKMTGPSERQYTFSASEAGQYRLVCEAGNSTVQVISCNLPMYLYSEQTPFHLLGTAGDVYFCVPAGVREFGIRVNGGGEGESVKAAIYNAGGQQVGEQDNIQAYQFLFQRRPTAGNEVWRLQLAKPAEGVLEDYYVQLQGIPPLLATSPEALPAGQTHAVDLREAAILVAGNSGAAAARMLQEEVQRRTGLTWEISTDRPDRRPAIVLAAADMKEFAGLTVPHRSGRDLPEFKKEGYRICVQADRDKGPVVWVIGDDARGILFGAGRLLRLLDWRPGWASLAETTDICTAPAYPIRGHQLGYRARANSYDAWNASAYEQYIRDLVLFGCNCIENIPFQDNQPSPHMPVSRDEMNVLLSKICDRYDLDYWVWTPVVFDLHDEVKRAAELKKHQSLYEACPRLDAVFVPGGDPGANPPELLLPFLKEIGEALMARHPEARVWLSLQWFNDTQIDEVYAYIEQNKPNWLGGLVAGPSSPPIRETRERLPARYRLRHYPDITHSVRCQYPVPWWDPAFSLTLGRECPNPRPAYFACLHNWLASWTDGFLTYSDGIHDDVNKVVWNARGWDPQADVREILKDYARVFFRPDLAESVADGILALEKNWDGALAWNEAVEDTLSRWQNLEVRAPELKDNWRWQLCLLRSVYDAYTRRRLLYETKLEDEANAALARAPEIGSGKAMDEARRILERAVQAPPAPQLRRRIEELCDALFQSIGLQTSVPKYHASGPERGAILDYVDYPLNNRWWLEDEFTKIRSLESEQQRLKRLAEIRCRENPGPGSFYDDVGNVAKSPHVVRGEGWKTDPLLDHDPNPGHWWWDNGFSRQRLSWQVSMDWPIAVRYEHIDPNADYLIRLTGYGEALTRINQKRVTPTVYGRGIGEFKEFPVPRDVMRSGRIEVTWDRPEESHLNWREQSRITEIWLLKKQGEAGK